MILCNFDGQNLSLGDIVLIKGLVHIVAYNKECFAMCLYSDGGFHKHLSFIETLGGDWEYGGNIQDDSADEHIVGCTPVSILNKCKNNDTLSLKLYLYV